MHEKPLLTWRVAPGVGGDETGKCSWEFPLEGILLLLPLNQRSLILWSCGRPRSRGVPPSRWLLPYLHGRVMCFPGDSAVSFTASFASSGLVAGMQRRGGRLGFGKVKLW